MALPLVSVIVPAYNHEKYIETCLASVVAQDYRPIEIILIDDGSQDDTFELAHQYLDRNYPVSVKIKNSNCGAASTINQAISVSSGNYINIINSDDYFEKGRISLCVDNALRHRAELIFANVNFVDEIGKNCEMDDYMIHLRKVNNRIENFPSIGFAFLKNQIAISTGNLFFSRRLFNVVGGFGRYLYVHDWDFILRCIFYTEPLHLKHKLYNYRFHEKNSSKSLADVSERETSEILTNALQRFTSEFPLNPRAPCPWYWPGVFEQFVKTVSVNAIHSSSSLY